MNKLTLIDIEKKYKDNPPTDEEILKRWTRLGLLSKQFDDELKMGIAKSYEDMAKTLTFDETEDKDTETEANLTSREWFEMVIFPIINRVVRAYYYKHNEIKEITGKEYIDFFKNTSVGDIIENSHPIYDDKDYLGNVLTNDEYTEMINDRLFTKDCFNKLFENFDKNTKLYNLVYSEIHDKLNNIVKELSQSTNDSKHYNTLDIEAVFVAMICDVLVIELFEK